jgi:WD40 repeat protein
MIPFARRIEFAVAALIFAATTSAAQPPKPVPMPPADEIKDAVATLKDVFDKEYGSTRDRALAAKLFQLASQRKTPAMIFACYDEARRLAAASGDVKRALDAIEALNRRFTNLPPSLLRDTIRQLANAEVPMADTLELAHLARAEAAIALEREDYAGAAELAGIATTAAKKTEDPALALDLHEYKTKLENLSKAADTVKAKPDDPDANGVLGAYWALERGNWGVGLKHLAKGSDKALASAATKDLGAPKSAKERTALGDAWFKLSQTGEGDRKQLLAQRAWEWYTAAVMVAMGDDDLKPSERAKEIERLFPDLFNAKFEGHTLPVAGIVATPDGKTIISVGNDSVRVWDAATGKLRKTLEGHGGWVGCVILSPDGTKAYTAGGDNIIRIWDVATLEPLGTLEGHTVAIRGLAISADGKLLVSGASDKTVRLWDLTTGKLIRKFGTEMYSVESVAIAPDGSHVLAGTDNGVITVFDAKTGDAVSKFEHPGGTMVYTIAVTKDGKTALSGARDKIVRVWEIETGKELRTLAGHTEQVYQVVLSSDEKQALSASFDKTVRVWDFATGKELKKFEGHTDGVQGVCFGADGRTVFSASWDKTVRKWRLPPDLVMPAVKKDN